MTLAASAPTLALTMPLMLSVGSISPSSSERPAFSAGEAQFLGELRVG